MGVCDHDLKAFPAAATASSMSCLVATGTCLRCQSRTVTNIGGTEQCIIVPLISKDLVYTTPNMSTYIPVVLTSGWVNTIIECGSASLLAIHNVIKLVKDNGRYFRRRHGERSSW